jgi:hypothetical protein
LLQYRLSPEASFTSLLAEYQQEEITQVGQLVEQKLEALVAEVTADVGA